MMRDTRRFDASGSAKFSEKTAIDDDDIEVVSVMLKNATLIRETKSTKSFIFFVTFLS